MAGKQLKVSIIIPLQRLASVADSSQVLVELSKKFDVSVITPVGVHTPSYFKTSLYKEFFIGKYMREILLNAYTMELSGQVKSFRTRINETLQLPEKSINGQHIRWRLSRKIAFRPRTLLSFIVYKLIKKTKCETLLQRIVEFWPSLRSTLLAAKPDIILVFSGGSFSGVECVVLSLAKRMDKKSILIVDNWDNLNSKSIFWTSPFALGVWGPNMERDARVIHRMTPRFIEHVGSARFRPNEREIESVNIPFILFAGSGKPLFDEVSALRTIRELLDLNGRDYLRVIYRPHPLSSLSFSEIKAKTTKLENVEIDPSFSSDLSRNFYANEPLEYLEMLCRNAKFVIAPQSSIIVESLSVGTPVVSLNWKKNREQVRPLSEYTHFSELEKLHGFYPINSWSEFSELLDLLLDFKKSSNLVPMILPSFTETYASRVVNLVSKVEEVILYEM